MGGLDRGRQAVGASPVSRINSSTTLRIVVSPRRWWCNGSDRTSANGGWHLATQHGAFEAGGRLDRCRITFRRGESPTPPCPQVASMQVRQRRPASRRPAVRRGRLRMRSQPGGMTRPAVQALLPGAPGATGTFVMEGSVAAAPTLEAAMGRASLSTQRSHDCNPDQGSSSAPASSSLWIIRLARSCGFRSCCAGYRVVHPLRYDALARAHVTHAAHDLTPLQCLRAVTASPFRR